MGVQCNFVENKPERPVGRTAHNILGITVNPYKVCIVTCHTIWSKI